jgi:hypothetical protein
MPMIWPMSPALFPSCAQARHSSCRSLNFGRGPWGAGLEPGVEFQCMSAIRRERVTRTCCGRNIRKMALVPLKPEAVLNLQLSCTEAATDLRLTCNFHAVLILFPGPRSFTLPNA